ncbi:hypothetical protein M8009_18370 [Halomonas sp. ATCH28]|uniref:Uncharacterized protein n=1 Tax=Halomonas gemina TaxID=2945105 RepID=A0ABT0T626_9GAMM|nr:hypothetical protein [Halomonas gemina]MCL7942247.1 hypothetical protein [Halomonas gemina]
MPLHIEMLTDDDDEQKYAPICEDYWRQDEQGNFALKITDIANSYGMKPQSVSQFVAQRAAVWLDELLCSECKQPFHFSTRSEYQEKQKILNRACAPCLKTIKKTIENENNCLKLEFNEVAKNENLNLENIDLKSRVYLLSALQALGNESLTSIGPLNKYPTCTLSPDPTYDKNILYYLIDRNILQARLGVHPYTVLPNENLHSGIDIGRTAIALGFENEQISLFLTNFCDDAKMGRLKASNEFIDLCMEIQMHECISFLDQALADHQIFSDQGDKTKLVFSQCLSRFSVAQTYSFIWSGVEDAAAFYNRYPIDMSEAANASIIYISRYMERALVHGWEIKPYRRPHNLPQSCLSRIVFNTILGTNDGGFNHPLYQLIEPSDLETV